MLLLSWFCLSHAWMAGQLSSPSGRLRSCCSELTRPVASVMVGELWGMGVPRWLPGIPLARLSRSEPSKLWRGLLRKP